MPLAWQGTWVRGVLDSSNEGEQLEKGQTVGRILP